MFVCFCFIVATAAYIDTYWHMLSLHGALPVWALEGTLKGREAVERPVRLAPDPLRQRVDAAAERRAPDPHAETRPRPLPLRAVESQVGEGHVEIGRAQV